MTASSRARIAARFGLGHVGDAGDDTGRLTVLGAQRLGDHADQALGPRAARRHADDDVIVVSRVERDVERLLEP